MALRVIHRRAVQGPCIDSAVHVTPHHVPDVRAVVDLGDHLGTTFQEVRVRLEGGVLVGVLNARVPCGERVISDNGPVVVELLLSVPGAFFGDFVKPTIHFVEVEFQQLLAVLLVDVQYAICFSTANLPSLFLGVVELL